MNPMSGCDVRLVFTLPLRDSTKDAYNSEITFLELHPWNPLNSVNIKQGYNVRKVISELYASFVLQCTVSGR